MSYIIKYDPAVDSRIIVNTIPPNFNSQTPQWFRNLEGSIIHSGFRNPIVLTAHTEQISTRYGGSRLWIAQKHFMKVPAIIADFDNVFPNATVITFEEINDYFMDKPAHIIRKPYGLNISGCDHAHMKEKL